MQPSVRHGILVAAVVLVALSQTRRPVVDAPPATPPQAAPAADRPTGPVSPESCRTCHTEVATGAVVHGPLAVGACAACHAVDSVEKHTFKRTRDGAALCTYCHDVPLDGAVSVHAPLAAGGDCTSCHDPHGGATRALLVGNATADALCRNCHGDVTGDATHVHGPVAVGACSACHNPHASTHAGLLRMPVREMCTSCHVSTQARLDGMRVVHAPAQDDCTACHDPHAAEQPMLLTDEPQQLCLGCHEAIRHTVDTAATQHAAVTTERQCLNCHDPHASEHPRVLRDDMTKLCLECHDRPIEMPDGRALLDMEHVLSTGVSLHGPVAQSNCAACHMIHGGDHFRMLVRDYPPEFYAPFAEERYALCFGCHPRDLVYDAHTTSLTDFRNGDLNLHYLHVNRETKGRSCRACHDTHAASNDQHIRASVPFGSGGWELPIGYTATDTGGSCAPGCHRPYAYDRVEAVLYPAPDAKAVWPKEP